MYYRKRVFIACVCLTVHVGMGVPGKTIETWGQTESQHQPSLGTFRSVTFHIMIRYQRGMTNHHFWHCGCINCWRTTSSITQLGGVKSVQIKSASQIFQSADKLETVALTKKLMSEESWWLMTLPESLEWVYSTETLLTWSTQSIIG